MSQHSTPKFDPMPPDDPNDITRSRAELQTANGAPSQPAAIEPQRMFDERSDDDEQEDDGPNTMDDGDQNCAVIELTVNGEPRQRKRARTRQNFSWRQVSVLEQVFEIGPLPSPALRFELATKLNLSPRCVQVWFQNRRQKWKALFHASGQMAPPLKNVQHRSVQDVDALIQNLSAHAGSFPLHPPLQANESDKSIGSQQPGVSGPAAAPTNGENLSFPSDAGRNDWNQVNKFVSELRWQAQRAQQWPGQHLQSHTRSSTSQEIRISSEQRSGAESVPLSTSSATASSIDAPAASVQPVRFYGFNDNWPVISPYPTGRPAADGGPVLPAPGQLSHSDQKSLLHSSPNVSCHYLPVPCGGSDVDGSQLLDAAEPGLSAATPEMQSSAYTAHRPLQPSELPPQQVLMQHQFHRISASESMLKQRTANAAGLPPPPQYGSVAMPQAPAMIPQASFPRPMPGMSPPTICSSPYGFLHVGFGLSQVPPSCMYSPTSQNAMMFPQQQVPSGVPCMMSPQRDFPVVPTPNMASQQAVGFPTEPTEQPRSHVWRNMSDLAANALTQLNGQQQRHPAAVSPNVGLPPAPYGYMTPYPVGAGTTRHPVAM